MTALLRRPSPVARAGPAASFNAPLFYELVAGLHTDPRHVVLDLGAASTEMLALLGPARCFVEIADFAHFDGISRLNDTATEPRRAEAADVLLPNRLSTEPISLVFLWDLPNYLTLNALSSLMAAIRNRAAMGAYVHALIVYAERNMPEHPGRFVPVADGGLQNLAGSHISVAAPRYSPEALGKAMGRFEIDRARLLANGMQEFLFRLGS